MLILIMLPGEFSVYLICLENNYFTDFVYKLPFVSVNVNSLTLFKTFGGNNVSRRFPEGQSTWFYIGNKWHLLHPQMPCWLNNTLAFIEFGPQTFKIAPGCTLNQGLSSLFLGLHNPERFWCVAIGHISFWQLIICWEEWRISCRVGWGHVNRQSLEKHHRVLWLPFYPHPWRGVALPHPLVPNPGSKYIFLSFCRIPLMEL